MESFKRILGAEEFTSLDFYKALVAEFLGTGLLVIVGCGSTASGQTTVEIALAFGLVVAVIVQAICHVSGGHINPAITVGMLVVGHCSIIRAIFYVIAQLVGAIIGALILYGLVHEEQRHHLGVTDISNRITPGQGVGIEIIITFILVLTVFAVCDAKRTDVKGSAPLAIGISISACHLYAIPYTGSSMNTARSFGPAVVIHQWRDHWIYWVGPLLGGIIAGILYKVVLEAPNKQEATTVNLDDAEQASTSKREI